MIKHHLLLRLQRFAQTFHSSQNNWGKKQARQPPGKQGKIGINELPELVKQKLQSLQHYSW